MRLTSSMRQAFIRSIMDDVPQIGYDEQIEKLVRATAAELLPPKVRAVWDDKELRGWIETTSFYHGGVHIHLVPNRAGGNCNFPVEALEKIRELHALEKAQEDARGMLRTKISGAASAFTTRKALAKALPEFEKYLPADTPAADRTLPVLANVVTDFMKAGWPKDQTKSQMKRRKAVASV